MRQTQKLHLWMGSLRLPAMSSRGIAETTTEVESSSAEAGLMLRVDASCRKVACVKVQANFLMDRGIFMDIYRPSFANISSDKISMLVVDERNWRWHIPAISR